MLDLIMKSAIVICAIVFAFAVIIGCILSLAGDDDLPSYPTSETDDERSGEP